MRRVSHVSHESHVTCHAATFSHLIFKGNDASYLIRITDWRICVCNIRLVPVSLSKWNDSVRLVTWTGLSHLENYRADLNLAETYRALKEVLRNAAHIPHFFTRLAECGEAMRCVSTDDDCRTERASQWFRASCAREGGGGGIAAIGLNAEVSRWCR